jgi:uncharacterized membrane protein
MSSVSQTPATGWGFRRRFALSMALVALVLAATIGPFIKGIAYEAVHARVHAPNLALFAGLPLAIKLHVLGALAALAVGAILMTVRKGRTFHRTAGWVWVGLVSLVAGSSLFITSLNHGRFSLLHLVTGWTLIALPLAVVWARRHDVRRHRRTMMGLFYGGFALNLFVAFIPGRTMWTMFFG